MTEGVQVSDNPEIAADVIGGFAYQRVKVNWGADNTSVDTSESNPLPVQAFGVSEVRLLGASSAYADVISSSAYDGVAVFVTGASGYVADVTENGLSVDLGSQTIGSTLGVNDVGIPVLAVRDDALETLTQDDGQYTLLRVDQSGKLWARSSIVGIDGDELNFAAPSAITFAPSIGTSACVQLDSLHTTIITFAGAASVQNGTGSIIGAGLWDKDDIGDAIRLWIFSRSVTGTTANAQLSVSDSDMAYCVGFIDFDDWADGAASKFALSDRTRLPLPYHCTNDGTALYGILQYVDSNTPTYTSGGLGGFIHVVSD